MQRLQFMIALGLLMLFQAGIAYHSGVIWPATRLRKGKSTGEYYMRRSQHSLVELKMGIFNSIKKLVSGQSFLERLTIENETTLKKYSKMVDQINQLEDSIEQLQNSELQLKTAEFRARLKQGEKLEDLLVEAFAVVREASWRVLRLRHFDVQLIAGMALHEGRLAEMKTGEGKTLAAVLPVYLNALAGEGAFVVTTNDYLARRDAENVGQVLRFLGLTVGVVQAQQSEAQRQQAYSCDVTYVSNQELGFDFLRDNLVLAPENIVQRRPYNFCLVDEADSILIDEARTPLIISRPGASARAKYATAAQIARNLNPKVHYEVSVKNQKVELTAAGFRFAEQILGKGLFELTDPWAYYIINALKAKELYIRDREYIVSQDGAVSIVDAFTGLEGRRFTDGLQQAVEAKENVNISAETQTIAKVTYQNLFRLFPNLCGMTGTALTDAAEFSDVYDLKVFPVPTHLPVARTDHPDATFRSQRGKTKALLRNVLSNHEKGRPVLIGTSSVEASEELVAALRDIGISAQLLNARPESVERESEIIAQAGRLGAVTVATNMAGRGTDILLGGCARDIARALAKRLLLVKLGVVSPSAAGVLEVTAAGESAPPDPKTQAALVLSSPVDESDLLPGAGTAETEEASLVVLAKSIDLWLPVEPSPAAELALQRALVSCAAQLSGSQSPNHVSTRLFVEDFIAQACDTAQVVATSAVTTPVTSSTGEAISALRTALGSLTAEFDTVVRQDRETVKELGGLYVVGTARHESRRIDNQLRGRAGRQGDPGSSRFFLSLEDDMFRAFGAEKMAGLLQSFRVGEDMPIESEIVTQALDKVQTQVEDTFREARQQVYQLDEVASYQRSVVYTQRRAFLTSSDAGMLTMLNRYSLQTMDEILSAAVKATAAAVAKDNAVLQVLPRGAVVQAERLSEKARQFFPGLQVSAEEIAALASSEESLRKLLHIRLEQTIAQKVAQLSITQHVQPAATASTTAPDDVGTNNAATPAQWTTASFFRSQVLVQLDEAWYRQLARLDLLREEMLLQSFTPEKDVMETYREKAMQLFSTLLDDVRRNAVYSLFMYKPPTRPT